MRLYPCTVRIVSHMVRISGDALTLAEAAEETGLSPSTLRVQIRNGRLKATKVGRDWLVTRPALRAYLENRSPQGRRSRGMKK